MSKEIVCVAKFRLPNGVEIGDYLKKFTVLERGHGDYFIITTSSTCNDTVQSLKDAVIEEIKELNPHFIRGVCHEELLSDVWVGSVH